MPGDQKKSNNFIVVALSGIANVFSSVRGRLMMAFGGITAMAVVGSGIGFLSYEWVDAALSAIVRDSIPALSAAHGLAEESARMVTIAPMLTASPDHARRQAVMKEVEARRLTLESLIGQVEKSGADADASAHARKEAQAIVGNLAKLDALVTERIDIAALQARKAEMIGRSHGAFLDILKPRTDAAGKQLKNSAETLRAAIDRAVTQLGEVARGDLVAAYELRLSSAVLVAAVRDGVRADTAQAVDAHWQSFAKEVTSTLKHADHFAKGDASSSIKRDIDRLAAFGSPPVDAFALRRRRLSPSLSADEEKQLTQKLAAIVKEASEIELGVREATSGLVRDAGAAFLLTTVDLQDEAAARIDDLVIRDLPSIRSALELAAAGNLLAGLIREAANAPNLEQLHALRDRYAGLAEEFEDRLDRLRGGDELEALRKEGASLVEQGRGAEGVFTLRERALVAATEENRLFMAGLDAAGRLAAASAQLVRASQLTADRVSGDAGAVVQQGRMWLIALAGFAVLAAILINWLVVGKHLIDRLLALAAAMRRISAGDLSYPIPVGGRDEVADMARALVVLRDTARQVEIVNARAEEDRNRAAEERRSGMLSLADTLEKSVKGVVDVLLARAGEMHAMAEAMSSASEKNRAEAAGATGVAATTRESIETMAEATRSLFETIKEISIRVVESARVADEAVIEARNTDATVKKLQDAAADIGNVVDMINKIASQTNLLALNATIEAARAGEAGKGFAVVAGEVKSLAVQTAQATDQITRQVAAIRNAGSAAASAIHQIGQRIHTMNGITSGIASAIEEEEIVTRQIAGSIEQVVSGAERMSQSIQSVSAEAGRTVDATTRVLGSSAEVARQAKTLNRDLASVLQHIRAA